jgi:hypothetical protein
MELLREEERWKALKTTLEQERKWRLTKLRQNHSLFNLIEEIDSSLTDSVGQ